MPVLNFGLWKGPFQGDYDSASCSCLELGRWTHVVAVVDSENLKLQFYVDGSLRGQTTIVRGILPGSSNLTIGEWPDGGRFLLGDVDDVAIWNRTLVVQEIAALEREPAPDP